MRLIGANGVLTDKAVTLLSIDDHDPAASAQIFVASFPAPAGQVVRVRAARRHDRPRHAAHPASTHQSSRVSQPAAGATIQDCMTVAWQASDPDVDPLVFTLQYSYDGGTTWQALTSDVVGTPNPNYQIVLTDLSGLHGSARQRGARARDRQRRLQHHHRHVAAFTLVNRNPVPSSPTRGRADP